MPLNTLGVVSAVTPSVIETYFSHYLNRGPLRQKPTAHISYHEGLRLIRQFLDYSAKHTVEDLQAFTAQWVPAPTWVKLQDVELGAQFMDRSAELVLAQLGSKGIELVGGSSWWRWRRLEQPMKAEWIGMKKDYNEWKRAGKCDRAILYVHGGAYYFGSVDEHRYQIQRHARKLKARVLAPRYRLAPQFPFPCGLYDCIAAYLYLLESFQPSEILLAGDSAGGGMVLSMLVTLRDQGQPLPAGSILLSPWVDLTHSFPSVAGDGAGDYIPPYGFHHKPSMVWPPPSSDELKALADGPIKKKKSKNDLPSAADSESKLPSQDRDLSITIDGEIIQIKDQIQLYTTNSMLAHPLVSPVQQASLGGLPPMLIQVGGAELLRDEQVYVAHKAANPKAYPPGDRVIAEYGINRDDITKYPPTDVQLQVWDDLCHVPHTLSFTRPAKYMYRAVAQFGAWALAHAQHRPITIMDDDQISIISSGPDTDLEASASTTSLGSEKTNGAFPSRRDEGSPTGAVGKAGDPLPRFKEHMIRQRVDRHGVTYPLALPGELACLHLDPQSIGAIKPGPVRKWLTRKREMDTKFSSEKKKVQKKRLKEMQQGYDIIGKDECPPPTALAGRRRADMPAEKRIKKSWGLAMWSGWGSSHDESTIERTDKLERENGMRPVSRRPSALDNAPEPATEAMASQTNGGLKPEAARKKRRTSGSSILSAPWSHKQANRPSSPYRKVTDTGQAGESSLAGDSLRPPSRGVSQRSGQSVSTASALGSRPGSQAAHAADGSGHQQQPSSASSLTALPLASPSTREVLPDSTKVEGSENTFQSPGNNRPHNGTVAYPFKIRNPMPSLTASASTTTLNSEEPDSASAATGTAASSSTIPRPQHDYSDKEMVVPFHEKEVVVNQPDPVTPIDGRNTPFRVRNLPTDPRLARLDTQRPASPSHSGSLPASPADTYGERNLFHPRNPAFDPRMASKFGPASPHSEVSSPIDQGRGLPPPKPVGFTYNPRDLRNAMLNRQAAESAAALSQQASNVSSPAHTPLAQSESAGGLSFTAVELPAISIPQHRPSAETLSRTTSRASEAARTPASEARPVEPMPVELSAMPSQRKPVPAPSSTTTRAPAPPEPATTAVRENVIMPVVEPRKPLAHPPPPPPPKDDPATVQLLRKLSSHSLKDRKENKPGGVQMKAPVIGEISGLREQSKIDLDPTLVNHEDVGKT